MRVFDGHAAVRWDLQNRRIVVKVMRTATLRAKARTYSARFSGTSGTRALPGFADVLLVLEACKIRALSNP